MTTLQTLTARDLMNAKVITLASNATIREAIATFEDENITGAPVVDAGGTPVGFLTTHDITRTEHLSGSRLADERHDDGMAEPTGEGFDDDAMADRDIYSREDYSSAILGSQLVQDWMSSGIISVQPDDDIKTVCNMLVEKGIHRVLVLEKGEIIGLVTTFDIVGHLAQTL